MPRGGKRPGAGAPPGNLNAVKHGNYSRRLRLFLRLAEDTPIIREHFIRLLNLLLGRRRHARRISRTDYLRLLKSLKNVPDPEMNRAIDSLLRGLQAKAEETSKKVIPPAMNQSKKRSRKQKNQPKVDIPIVNNQKLELQTFDCSIPCREGTALMDETLGLPAHGEPLKPFDGARESRTEPT